MSRFAAAVTLSLQICELGPPSVQNLKRETASGFGNLKLTIQKSRSYHQRFSNFESPTRRRHLTLLSMVHLVSLDQWLST